MYEICFQGAPSCVRMFQYPNFGNGQAVANKSFFKADKVEMFWNKKGRFLLYVYYKVHYLYNDCKKKQVYKN